MNRSGCPISEVLVGSLVIVKLEVISQTYLQSRNCSIFVDIDVLILDAAPEPLDEDVIEGATPTIYADLDLVALQLAGKIN